MKLAKHNNSLETNAEVTSQEFGIGDASVVIEILRNRLYEHKIRTLVQEYMCNGRDAQREIKSKAKLIVTIPNALNPVFKVRDFGPGISPERMSKVFIQYGASTKRGTNGQTGGFGIGAKSAWSYTDSFTIVTINEGIKSTYVAHTGVNNQGRLDKISEVETDEESGTEIQVAVKPHDISEFKESVFRASYFWSQEEKPEYKGVPATELPTYVSGISIGKLELVKSVPSFIPTDWNNKCTLAIDGIPYTLGQKLIDALPNVKSLLSRINCNTLIRIGNGIVEVSASREAIADSEFTRKNLNDLAETLLEGFKKYILAEFKAVKSNAEWIKTYKELSTLAKVDEHSRYNDYRIERSAIESLHFASIDMQYARLKYKRGHYKLDLYPVRYVHLLQVEEVFFIDNKDESATIQNKRIREYLEKNKKDNIIIIKACELYETVPYPSVNITTAPTKGSSVPGPITLPSPTVKKIKLSLADSQKIVEKIKKDFSARPLSSLPFTPVVRIPKAKRDRTKEMFTIHDCTNVRKSPMTTTLEEITNDGTNWMYINFKEYGFMKSELTEMAEFLAKEGYTVCALTDETIEMVEGDSHFKSYREWKDAFKPGAKTIASAKNGKSKNISLIKMLKKATDKIKDKHIAKMMDEYSLIINKDHDVPETITKMIQDEIDAFVTEDEKLTKLVEKTYPLLNLVVREDWRYGHKDVNELVFYINAKN